MPDIATSSTYGFVELRELEDAAVLNHFDDTVEARFAGDRLGATQMSVSLQRVKPDRRLDFAHRHQCDEEIYVVVSGDGRALVDEQVVDLRPWSCLRIAPGAAHTFEAGADGLEFVVVRASHGTDDSEPVQMTWPASRSADRESAS